LRVGRGVPEEKQKLTNKKIILDFNRD